MTITIDEFARRICEANHKMHFANQTDSRVPCGIHLSLAKTSWGLIQPGGAKTLAVICEVADQAGLFDAAARDPHTRAVMNLVGKNTLTTDDWDRYLSGTQIANAGGPAALARPEHFDDDGCYERGRTDEHHLAMYPEAVADG